MTSFALESGPGVLILEEVAELVEGADSAVVKIINCSDESHKILRISDFDGMFEIS
jgi:hypothetical protein